MKIRGNRLFSAFAAAIVLATAASAQDSISRKDLDSRLDKALYEVAVAGTELYNGEKQDYEGCARLYEGALRAVLPLLDNRPELRERVEKTLSSTANDQAADRAHALRDAIDEIRATIKGESKNSGEKPRTESKQPKKSSQGPDDGRSKPDSRQQNPANPKEESNKPKLTPKESKPQPNNQQPSTEPAKPSSTGSKSLWEQLGGEKSVRSIVHEAVKNMQDEPKLDLSRGGKYTDYAKLEASLVSYLSSVSGGPLKYDGKDMKTAHAGMQITDEQFNIFWNKLADALYDAKAPTEAVDRLKTIVESTRKDIVGK
jgi:hemoglobin